MQSQKKFPEGPLQSPRRPFKNPLSAPRGPPWAPSGAPQARGPRNFVTGVTPCHRPCQGSNGLKNKNIAKNSRSLEILQNQNFG